MLKLVRCSSCPPTLLQFSHLSRNTRSPSLPSVPSIGTVQENKRSASEETTLCQSQLSKSRRDALNCILQRSCSLLSQSLPVTSALCVESAHIDPASDKHVLSGKLLEITACWRGETSILPHPDHKAFDKWEGAEVQGLDGGKGRWNWMRIQRGNGEVGIISFCLNHKLSTDRQKPLPDVVGVFFLRAFKMEMFNLTLPCLLSVVKPRPNHKPPCVISQQCFRLPGLMAQCSLYDMCRLTGRSVLLFSTNLIPKLFKHCFFFLHTQWRVQTCLCLSICGCMCESERGSGKMVYGQNILWARWLFVFSHFWLSCKNNTLHYYSMWQLKRSINTRTTVIFILLELSINIAVIYITSSTLCMRNINHIVNNLYGHFGSSISFLAQIILYAAVELVPFGCWADTNLQFDYVELIVA